MLGTVILALSVDYLIYPHRHFYIFLLTLSELGVVKDSLLTHKSQQLAKNNQSAYIFSVFNISELPIDLLAPSLERPTD